MSDSEEQPRDSPAQAKPDELTGTPEQKQPPRFICNDCASPVTEAHKGGDGTQFYSCPKCGCVNHKKVRQEEAEQTASAAEPESPDGVAGLIGDPFTTEFDVSDETPVADIPPEYYRHQSQRLNDACKEAKASEEAVVALSRNPDVEGFILSEVHTTVSKYDVHIVRAVLHTGLSAYLDPLHLALKCDSGGGKTYTTTETIQVFPPEDVQFIGSQSPKVISHDNGIWKAQDGTPIDPSQKPVKPRNSDYPDKSDHDAAMSRYEEESKIWRDRVDHSFYEVDLNNKTVVFMESVNEETFKMLKATMSRDHDFIDHKYVDDKGKVHVTRLLGSPAIIFNSVDKEYWEEQATRCLAATPDTSQAKIEDSMQISNLKHNYPWLYGKDLKKKRAVIQEYIRKIKQFIKKGKIQVVNPFVGLFEGFDRDATRDMRDFNKFLELVPSYALFHLFQRPLLIIRGGRYLLPTVQDVLDAKATFDSIVETTKTGTDFRVIEFYYTIVADRVNGSDAEALTDFYNKERKHKMTVKTVRRWLQRLEELGWVDIREGERTNSKGFVDKRFNLYLPLKKHANALTDSMSVSLEPILINGFNKWLENTTNDIDSTQKIIVLNIDGTAREISIEKMKQLIIKKREEYNMGVFSTPEPDPKKENKPEDMPADKMGALAHSSNRGKSYPDRCCSDECVNYDKPSCTAPNWQALNKTSVLPFDCEGFKAPNPGEEDS